nr:sulfatase [Verrucomicrobiota bacterium]
KVRLARVAEARAAGKKFNHSHDWPRAAMWDAPDVPDDELQEGEIAARAVALLRERAQTPERPFFLAVGFLKPHTPYVAPKRYWDLYDRAALRLPANQFPPQYAPPWAVPVGLGMGGFANAPQGAPDDELKRTLLHAYLASISYMDASAGRVLAALDELGLARNTVVAVLGDHGYQMGEHGSWNQKHCNFETATRVPLLVRAPGMAAAGSSTGALVELVDLYPTLAGLAGIDAPASLEGTSFRPLLAQPQRPWKTAAFSEMPRAGKLGRAIRTERHRYVEWTDAGGAVVARELYDHATDPSENQNLAGQAANGETVATLARQLRAGWRAARPARLTSSPPPKS